MNLNEMRSVLERPGALTFLLRDAGRWMELAVEDAGGGIPSDQLSRVFEPLFTTRRHGTGLGLTLCRRVVAAHGGEIDVESEEGLGTRVVMRLPVQEERMP
jgi:signal transduction histidine kinase